VPIILPAIRPIALLAALLVCAGFLVPRARAQSQIELSNHLLVVYNEILPQSQSLAEYYAQRRGIPKERLLGIRCPVDEEITRADYRSQIEDPIRAYLIKKKWMDQVPGKSPFGDQTLPIQCATYNQIWCILLIKGVPLKIANDPSVNEVPTKNPALNTNAASVDSELCLLPLQGLPLIGVLPNPYQLLGYNRPFDSLDAREMIMVGRLDGPSNEDVRRMIDDALYAEANRLTGRAKIDARGLTDDTSGYYQGDQWLIDSGRYLAKQGWDVEVDLKPEVFPENLPWRDVAIYAGWYAGGATGPFMHNGDTPVFSRGAIAYHIHSYSASTLRSATSNWCGPLIDKGAACTMGAVYEPYLDFMPRWDIFLEHLYEGNTFIESAYASQKVLSWMITFVGDPLYTPFALPLDQAVDKSASGTEQHEFLRLQQIREDLASGKLDETKAGLANLAADPQLTHVGWEGYADILSDPRLLPADSTVAAAYEKAFNLSSNLEDQIRTDLKAASAYEDRFRLRDAKRLLSMMLSRYPNESAYYGLPLILHQVEATGGIPAPGLNPPSNTPSGLSTGLAPSIAPSIAPNTGSSMKPSLSTSAVEAPPSIDSAAGNAAATSAPATP